MGYRIPGAVGFDRGTQNALSRARSIDNLRLFIESIAKQKLRPYIRRAALFEIDSSRYSIPGT